MKNTVWIPLLCLTAALSAGAAHAETRPAAGRPDETAAPYFWTPLHSAARDGNLARIRALAEGGADLEAREHLGRTPLYIAAQWGRTDAVRLLIERGARVDARDRWGHTPLRRLALLREVRGQDFSEVAEILRAHGAQE